MKLGYVIIYVEDVKITVDFYQKAFGMKEKFIHESGLYGELSTGETTLAFAANNMAEIHGFTLRENTPKKDPIAAEIAFVTKNVQTAYETAIKAGATGTLAPEEKPWGQTIAYVKDNNGFLVEICSPVS